LNFETPNPPSPNINRPAHGSNFNNALYARNDARLYSSTVWHSPLCLGNDFQIAKSNLTLLAGFVLASIELATNLLNPSENAERVLPLSSRYSGRGIEAKQIKLSSTLFGSVLALDISLEFFKGDATTTGNKISPRPEDRFVIELVNLGEEFFSN
jgi:hypothetical protein